MSQEDQAAGDNHDIPFYESITLTWRSESENRKVKQIFNDVLMARLQGIRDALPLADMRARFLEDRARQRQASSGADNPEWQGNSDDED